MKKLILSLTLVLSTHAFANSDEVCGRAVGMVVFDHGIVSLDIETKSNSNFRYPITDKMIPLARIALENPSLKVCGIPGTDNIRTLTTLTVRSKK